MIDRTDIIKAWLFLRENNCDLPDEVLDFIKDAAIEKLNVLTIGTLCRVCRKPEDAHVPYGHKYQPINKIISGS